MIAGLRTRGAMLSLLIATFALLPACSIGTATTLPMPVPTLTPSPMPTPSPSPAPVAGVCNPADFPSGQGPTGARVDGPPTQDIQYPPLTYYFTIGGTAGSHVYTVCSSGDAASILAFMKDSIPAGGWTILETTATTIRAQKPTNPPSGYCYSLAVKVGQDAAYPGEWTITFYSPATACA